MSLSPQNQNTHRLHPQPMFNLGKFVSNVLTMGIWMFSFSLTVLFYVCAWKQNSYPSFKFNKSGSFLETCFHRVKINGHWLRSRGQREKRDPHSGSGGKEVRDWSSGRQPWLLHHAASAEFWDQCGLLQCLEGANTIAHFLKVIWAWGKMFKWSKRNPSEK